MATLRELRDAFICELIRIKSTLLFFEAERASRLKGGSGLGRKKGNACYSYTPFSPEKPSITPQQGMSLQHLLSSQAQHPGPRWLDLGLSMGCERWYPGTHVCFLTVFKYPNNLFTFPVRCLCVCVCLELCLGFFISRALVCGCFSR